MSDKKDPNTIVLKNVRASFVNVHRPVSFQGGDPRYEITALLDPSNKEHAALIKKADKMTDRLIKQELEIKKLPAHKRPVKDGDEKEYDGYAGMKFIAAGNRKPIHVVGKDPSAPLKEESGKPYSGCYCNIAIRLWAQDNQYGKRINASLESVQFIKDGEPFGAKPADPTSLFEEVEDDEGDFDDEDGDEEDYE